MTQITTNTNKRKRQRGNGDGSIIKLSGNRKNPYAARVTMGWSMDGKQIVKYVGYYPTKSAAKKALNDYLANPYSLDKVTTQSVFDEWSATAKITDGVVKNYKNVVKNSGLANKVFKDIKLIELENAARDLTPSMQKRFRNAFKNLYQYSMRHDMVQKNLADLMELDKYEAGEKDVISKEDVEKMLAHEDPIPTLLLYTGMRITELLEVKSENVDLEKRILIGGKKSRAGRNRKIPIHKKIVPIVEKLLAEENEYLLTNAKGKMIVYDTYLKGTWHKDELLSKYVMHQTRHTFVSRVGKLGLDRGVLQKIIGHSNKDITDVYNHIDDNQLLEFIDAFNY